MAINRLSHRVRLLLAPLLLLGFGLAHADKLDDDLQTVWESLWDQRGTPQLLARWEHQVRFRIFGADAARHREHIIRALEAAGQATRLRMINVSDDPDAEKTATLDIEIVKDHELQDNEACFMRPLKATNQAFDKVQVRMRSQSAWSCTFHEVMHAMGIPGHPSGKTVLSYFPYRRDTLMDLDKLMLAAWYSPAMPRRATPFEALVVLSEAVARQPDLGLPASEAQSRAKAFTLATLKEMESFASGTGEIPAIVKRSGKASSAYMDEARRAIGFFIGGAYLQGTIAAKDAPTAAQWFKRTAELGYLPAQIMWGTVLASGMGVEKDQAAACAWFDRAASELNTVGKTEIGKLKRNFCPPTPEKVQASLTQ
ncbi:tetratricopeptide repeat protein [Polaromonas sp.]|uniref:tetratricopeptide repeat protein n=1 Tax=Polaromonas sp. TaxID=1869339 RepID=UPI002FC8B88E